MTTSFSQILGSHVFNKSSIIISVLIIYAEGVE